LHLVKRLDRLLASIPFHPFLLAAFVVLQLYALNIAEVPAGDALTALAVVLALTAAGFGLTWLLYREVRRAAILTAFTLMLLLNFGHVRVALLPYGIDSGLLLLLGYIVAIALVAIAAAKANRSLLPLTQALNLVSLVMLLMATVSIASYTRDALSVPQGLGLDSLPPITTNMASSSRAEGPLPDIYYVVLDRYGSEQALEVGHGVSTAAFMDWLRVQGFQVVDGARANYVRSTLSIASALSAAPLDDIVKEIGPDSGVHAPVHERISHSRVAAFLQKQGYEYVHLGSWFGPTRESEVADRSLAPEAEVDFASTLFELSILHGVLTEVSPHSGFVSTHAAAAEYQLEQLEALVREPGPKFVVAHVLLPHDPYVFLEDGTFSPGEATFETQLAFTNARLAELVTSLLDRPEGERPIVILQADEGPYPAQYEAHPDDFDWSAATEAEVAEKFGILTAMYLPGPEGEAPLPATMSPVNTFREVLGRYFEADLPVLPDRSFASTQARPYDMVELTDRFVTSEDGGSESTTP
jgi:hypothetical protein